MTREELRDGAQRISEMTQAKTQAMDERRDTYRCPCCEQDVPCHREHSWTECSGYLKAQIYHLKIDIIAAKKPAPERIAQLEAEVALWKRQRAADSKRWQERYQRQVDYTNIWHGRYEVLRHENNKLRKRMERTREEGSPASEEGIRNVLDIDVKT